MMVVERVFQTVSYPVVETVLSLVSVLDYLKIDIKDVMMVERLETIKEI